MLYGNIGEITPFKDIRGENLYVGDIVTLISKDGLNIGKRVVVKKDGKFFVYGIASDCHEHGIKGKWTLIKEKSFEDLKHLEAIEIHEATIEAVLKED